jgi:K+-sensing histidine kinase KdpD
MLTAFTDYEVVLDAVNKGQIYGFFNKPFDPHAIRAAINNAIEIYKLQKINHKILKDLEKANSELIQLDISKNRFLDLISNEIRTPINKIMTAVHVLKDKVETAEIIELLQLLDASASQLESFSISATRLARLNEGKGLGNITKINLKEMAGYGILEVKNLLDERGIAVELAEPETEIFIHGEYELLVVCLANLITYTVHQISKKGTIKCIFSHDEQYSSIELVNHGLFLSKKRIDDLIHFFAMEEGTFDYGIGMELLLAKKIMLSHGGKIEVISNEDQSVSMKLDFPDPVKLNGI